MTEITPEMMRAGLDAFWSFERDYPDGAEIVTAVYEAMDSAANEQAAEIQKAVNAITEQWDSRPTPSAETAHIVNAALARIGAT